MTMSLWGAVCFAVVLALLAGSSSQDRVVETTIGKDCPTAAPFIHESVFCSFSEPKLPSMAATSLRPISGLFWVSGQTPLETLPLFMRCLAIAKV